MDYVGAIYRPPSEAGSLLLQVTVGCSHDRCTFCGMYAGKTFRPKPWETIQADIAEARTAGPWTRRVFLCDGDALVLATERLLTILHEIRTQLPWIERVGVYGDPRGLRHKSDEDLGRLRAAGLGIVYHGLESGDDEVLRRIDKGFDATEAVDMGRRLAQAGIRHSVIVLLGIAGVAGSQRHAQESARILSAIDPAFASALTVTLVPGTRLHQEHERGQFQLPDRFALLGELRTLLAGTRLTSCLFSSNHASNYLPLQGHLPEAQGRLLQLLDEVLRTRDERWLRPEHLRGL